MSVVKCMVEVENTCFVKIIKFLIILTLAKTKDTDIQIIYKITETVMVETVKIYKY